MGEKGTLEHITAVVSKQDRVGIIGENGAGKTTRIRIINHITRPDIGEVVFDGHPRSRADVAYI